MAGNGNPPHHSFDTVSVSADSDMWLIDEHARIRILGTSFRRIDSDLQASQLWEIC